MRIADVLEHVNRVLNHSRRLENGIETAVQLHFSANAHRTNQIVRTLTVITAIFAPLTLITGIFGMNVGGLPGLHGDHGFWWVMMLILASGGVTLAAFFWRRLL